MKADMLSRRTFFGGAAAAAAAMAMVAVLPTSVSVAQPIISGQKLADLTHELGEDFPTFFGDQQARIEKRFTFAKEGYNANNWWIYEHTGTHIDAPLHYSADGKSVAEIPLADLVAPLVVVDIRDKASRNADAELTPDDIKAWTNKHGPIPRGAVVAMNSGWGPLLKAPKFRNAGANGKTLHFPGFHVETTKQLLELDSIKGIAVDTLSLDRGNSTDIAVHKAWLPAGRYGIEALANLDDVPALGATLVVGAPKIRGATGGPSRIFAFI